MARDQRDRLRMKIESTYRLTEKETIILNEK